MKQGESILLFVTISLISTSILVSFLDTPIIQKPVINDWLCKHNRILCLHNLPPVSDECDPPMENPEASDRDVVLGMFCTKTWCNRRTFRNDIILMFLGDSLKGKENWNKVMKTYNVTVEYVSVPEGWNMVNYRFVLYRDYLIKHSNDVDRVIFCDSKDIYFLRDPFKQIGKSKSLLIGREFRSENDKDYYSFDGFYQYYNNYVWMNQAYGLEVVEWMKKNDMVINNAGFGGGDIQSMTTLLTMWVDEMIRIGGQNRWGFDQAIYNYLIHSGKLKDVMDYIELGDCKHNRICMFSEKRIYLKNGIPYLYNGCVPHVLHRDGLTYNMMDVRRYPNNGLN
ncbi:Uncharacterized protein QTN25_010484 [Entamoeba marina]